MTAAVRPLLVLTLLLALAAVAGGVVAAPVAQAQGTPSWDDGAVGELPI